MCHGTHDGVVPPGLGEASRDVLVKLGYRIDWRSYPMAHQVCLEEVMDISKWLQERFV
jgi:phospholipase/carboxylesterase